jgi:transcriptional regulator with XRE-family HTH domain
MQPFAVSTIADMEFAAKLRRLCRLKGVSARKLAEDLGDVSKSKVSDWKKGTYVPDIREAVRLARYFDVSIAYLARDEIEEEDADGLAEDEREVLILYRALKSTSSIDRAKALSGLALAAQLPTPDVANPVDPGSGRRRTDDGKSGGRGAG